MGKIAIKVKGIIECQGKYLLLQRWFDDNIVTPYKWGFVDVDMEAGKGPDETVLDSIEDRTGLTVSVGRILYTWTYTVGETYYVGIAYLCRAEDDVVMISDEYSDSVWVGENEIKNYITEQSIIDDLEKYLISGEADNDELALEM